VAEWSKALPC